MTSGRDEEDLDALFAHLEMNRHRLPTQRKPQILIGGETGAGKSTTINAIFGEERAEIGAYERGTLEASAYQWDLRGENIDFVDLPGLGDIKSYDKKFKAMYRERIEGADGFIIVVKPDRPANAATMKVVNLLLSCGIEPFRMVFAYNRLSMYSIKIGDSYRAIDVGGLAGPQLPEELEFLEKARASFLNGLIDGTRRTAFQPDQIVFYDAMTGWNLFALLRRVLDVLPGDTLVKWRDAVAQAARHVEERTRRSLRTSQAAHKRELDMLQSEKAALQKEVEQLRSRKREHRANEGAAGQRDEDEYNRGRAQVSPSTAYEDRIHDLEQREEQLRARETAEQSRARDIERQEKALQRFAAERQSYEAVLVDRALSYVEPLVREVVGAATDLVRSVRTGVKKFWGWLKG